MNAEYYSKEGNNYFNQGNLEEAFNNYSKGIDLINESTDSKIISILYSNRGYVNSLFNNFIEAFEDYQISISKDPYFFKPLYRLFLLGFKINEIHLIFSKFEYLINNYEDKSIFSKIYEEINNIENKKNQKIKEKSIRTNIEIKNEITNDIFPDLFFHIYRNDFLLSINFVESILNKLELQNNNENIIFLNDIYSIYILGETNSNLENIYSFFNEKEFPSKSFPYIYNSSFFNDSISMSILLLILKFNLNNNFIIIKSK